MAVIEGVKITEFKKENGYSGNFICGLNRRMAVIEGFYCRLIIITEKSECGAYLTDHRSQLLVLIDGHLIGGRHELGAVVVVVGDLDRDLEEVRARLRPSVEGDDAEHVGGRGFTVQLSLQAEADWWREVEVC